MDYTELIPPLPEPDICEPECEFGEVPEIGAPMAPIGHSNDALKTYALAAIAAAAPAIRMAERERAIAACALPEPDDMGSWGDGYESAWRNCQDAIRALPEEP